MKKIGLILVFILFYVVSDAQKIDRAFLNWININAINVNNGDKYLELLKKQLEGNLILGLGESSHGTSEFYLQKNRIIDYLINKSDYKIIGFELNASLIAPLNQFVLTGKGDLKLLMKEFRLYNTEEFFELFTMIKNFNEKKNARNKITLFGIDEGYSYPERDSLMAVNVLKRTKKNGDKIIIWGHDAHLAKNTTAGFKGTGFFIKWKVGSAYYNIAFDTYKGSVNTISKKNGIWIVKSNNLELARNNFSELFSKVKYPVFFINFNPSSPYYGLTNNITHVFSDWNRPFEIPIKLGQDFDTIVFIRETTAAVMLN